jgi:predicted Zn-dependent protease
MSKRLLFLEKLTQEGSTDPMAWYGLALEYKSLGRMDDALRTFETLRARTPDYVPLYLMGGGVLDALGRKNDAAAWYREGMVHARKKGDAHALSELESALAVVGGAAD